MPLGRVGQIWRYPVSGLQGEKLDEGKVIHTGVAGDHVYVLRSKAQSKILDPISHSSSMGGAPAAHGMLELAATLSGDPAGEHDLTIQADGQTIFSSRKQSDTRLLSDSLGRDIELVRYPRIVESRVRAERTLHLLTNASIEQMKLRYPEGDFDARRFRPNIVVTVDDGLKGFAEEGWVGRELELGAEVRLLVTQANSRCKVTTMKQAGVKEDDGILRAIKTGNANNLGVMCTVAREGVLRVGDQVSLA
jgi:uncharacterized protein